MHNNGERLTIVGRPESGNFAAITLAMTQELTMKPRYVIQDVIKDNSMLFIGEELWISAVLRKDSKSKYVCYNVSEPVAKSSSIIDLKASSVPNKTKKAENIFSFEKLKSMLNP